MTNTQEIVRKTVSGEWTIRRLAAGLYGRTQSFYLTVVLMAAASGIPRESLLLFPWLVLEHYLRVGVDASLEFGRVSRKGGRRCVPHIWVVTDDGICDPVMESMMIDDRREILYLVYHKDAPPGYEHTDSEILDIARSAYDRGLQDYIYDGIQCPIIQTMAFELCTLSDRIAPLGAITL